MASDVQPKNQQGVILIVGAVALLGVFVIVGLIFDFGMWYLTRGELQHIADTTALRGAKQLGSIYVEVFETNRISDDPFTDPIASQNDLELAGDQVADITMVITNVVNQLQSGVAQITMANIDIEIGLWNEASTDFSPGLGTGTGSSPNAVRVTAGTNAAPLNLIFGKLLGISTLDIAPATSTAALTALSRIPPNVPTAGLPQGEIIFPMGVDILFANAMCSPTPNSCTSTEFTEITTACSIIDADVTPSIPTCFSWTSYNIDDENPTGRFASLVNGTQSSPMTRTRYSGDPSELIDPTPPPTGAPAYFFHGDAWDQVARYSTHPGLQPGAVGPFDHLEVVLPVYNTGAAGPTCTAPAVNTRLPVSGFISARLRNRGNGFQVKFGCGAVRTGRSGWRATGENFGTLGSEPVLVQ